MHRVYGVAFVLAVGLLLVTIELVRRRALREQYSFLWLVTGVVVLGLSLWPQALGGVAKLLGIYYAPSALLLIGLAFVLLILLHFSLVISKLSEENKELAQRHALLVWQAREMENRLSAHLAPERAGGLSRLSVVEESDRGAAVVR